ncbi:hypothetical protein FGB62_37g41 [Gracilaria domingensis]|nr:hypothetical protein FGB62_37g41 [Gracilaria domingensis]
MQRRWRGMRVAFLSGKHGEDVRAAAGPVCTVDGRVASMRKCAEFANIFANIFGADKHAAADSTGPRADCAAWAGGGERARRARRNDGTAGRWCWLHWRRCTGSPCSAR